MKKKLGFLMALVAMFLCTNGAWAETLYFAFGGGTASDALGGGANQTWTSNEHAGYSWAITSNTAKGISGANKVNAAPYYDGSLTTFKNSNGAQNTFYMPEGVKISNIKFIGYTNALESEGTCTLKEVNGVDVTENNTIAVYKDDATMVDKVLGTPGVIDYTFPEPVSGSFTFTMGGKQGCFIIVIETVEEETPAEPELIVWNINPADYTAGVQYAIDEAHVVNDTLTIYTTEMHWTTQLRVYSSSSHDGYFYSNQLPAAIKSIEFTAGNKVDVLVVYGSNDGVTWTEAAKVEVPSTSYTSGLVADLTGTAYNYFKVDVEGNQQVRISNLIITLDPSVELPKVVAAPTFSLNGCNLFAPATVELTAEEGATIYWSTNNVDFVEYTAALAIDSTCTVYAYAEVEGAKSAVASAEYVMAATYDNVAALLAAEATSNGVPVVVKLKAVVDSLGLNNSGEVTSAFLIEGTDTLMIYDYNIPADYVVGNKVKGQLAGLWKDYKGTLELCNVDYSGATAVAPVTVESPWVGAVAEAGATYYFYNPAAKAFLKAGNSWGTRASFGQDAYPIILEGADNVYALSTTLAFAGKGLRASDLFMDQSLDKFTFEEVGNGIYTFSSDGKYVAYTGVNTVEYAAEVNDGCYWQLLTADAIKEQMLVADENNPYDITALIPGANFGRSNAQNSAWVAENTANYSNAGGANNGDNNNQQVWNAGLTKVSQVLTGLPNGTYVLNAQAFYRLGGVAEAAAARTAGTEVYDVKLFANTDSVMVMSVMDEAGKLSVGANYEGYGTAPNTQGEARDFFIAGYYDHAIYFTVTDGTANIGIVKNSYVGFDWLVFDNFRLTYYGTASVEDVKLAVPRKAFVDRYTAMELFSQESLNYTWNGINNTYFWPVMDAAMLIKDDIENVTDLALLDSMMAEMDNAEAMVLKAYALGDEYNKVKNAFWDASDNSTATSDEARMAMEAALENSNYASYTLSTIEAVEAAIADLKAEYLAYVGNATPAEGFLFDVTSALVNPSFETGDLTGWTIARESADTGVRTNSGSHATEGTDGTHLFNSWWNGVLLSQEVVGLPDGKYTLTIAMAGGDAGNDATAYIIANTDTLGINLSNAGAFVDYSLDVEVSSQKLYVATVGGNDDDTADNPIGSFNPDGYWWYKADNFRLYYAGVAAATDPLAEKKAAFLERKNAFDVYSQESLNYTWNGINNNYFWPVSDAVYALADTLGNVTDVAILDQAMADMDNAEAMVEKAYVAGDRYNYFKELLWYAADNSTANSDEVRAALETVLEATNYASYTIATIEALETATVELKDAYLAYIPNAWGNTEGVTFDVTFMAGLTPRAGDSYDAATDAWSASGTSANAPEVTTADGRTAPMIEYNTRVGKEKLNSVVMQQTVWNLPNGTYNVELYANALNNNYEVALTDGDNTLVYVSANDVKTPVVAKNATAITESEVYAINGAVVTDGSLHLTLSKNDKDGTNWHTVQVKSISLVAPVQVAAGKKVVYDLDVERVAGLGYAAEERTIATSELAALLGVESLGEATIWGVNPDGSYVADAMAAYDGWRDVQGTFAAWGSETAAVCVKLFAEEAAYLISICTHGGNGNDPVAGTQSTAVWALVAGVDTVVINTNITFVEPTVLNIADLEVVSTITVAAQDSVGVGYSGVTASFDAAAAATALGLTSLADADQYILNVTDGTLVVNTTDGWRDANGDAASWGAENGVCVKINDPASGLVDYIGQMPDATYTAGQTYTAKWAFVHEGKAVVIEVVITFVDVDGINNLLNPDAPITVYSVNGKAIQTTVGGVKSLEKGIYIVNGKKILVK